MTAANGLLVALVFLLIGIAGVMRSVRNGQWAQQGWRIFWAIWIAVAGAIVLYNSLMVSNATPGG